MHPESGVMVYKKRRKKKTHADQGHDHLREGSRVLNRELKVAGVG
jgi:hypothetical protein